MVSLPVVDRRGRRSSPAGSSAVPPITSSSWLDSDLFPSGTTLGSGRLGSSRGDTPRPPGSGRGRLDTAFPVRGAGTDGCSLREAVRVGRRRPTGEERSCARLRPSVPASGANTIASVSPLLLDPRRRRALCVCRPVGARRPSRPPAVAGSGSPGGCGSRDLDRIGLTMADPSPPTPISRAAVRSPGAPEVEGRDGSSCPPLTTLSPASPFAVRDVAHRQSTYIASDESHIAILIVDRMPRGSHVRGVRDPRRSSRFRERRGSCTIYLPETRSPRRSGTRSIRDQFRRWN